MAELLMSERRDLITHYINNAKINWAHLAIAQLLKYGFVDRVLTVNFDPLVMRACALVGVFPAVYDFAASQIFKPDFIAQQSIFHLHGQHTGLVVLNTESEVDRLSQHLGPLFTDSVRRRVWIVAGYSGENDPVFEHLAKTERYDNGLYWICYKDNPPKKHVQERLLVGGKDCFFIQGFDADDFFVRLAQGLGCFPPTFVQTPFTHLENILQPVLPYSLPGNDSSLEAIPKKLLQDAIEKIEKPGSVALKARELLLMGNYNAVIEMETELANTRTDELVELVAWGYLYAGNEFGLEADGKTGEEADRLWSQAYKKYAAALKIDPNCSEALNNWAVALDSQARTKNGQEAEQLWALAVEKYGAALKINPEFADPLYNWGRVLVAQAERKKGKAVQQLLMRAAQKYEEALKIEPDKIAALDNLGHVFFCLAQTTSGKQADQLWTQAAEKFEAIVRLDPKDCDALTNGAMVLLKHSITKTVEEADRMWTLAAEKCKAALKLKPDDHTAFYNWSLALQLRADNSIPKEAKRLHELANEKLAAARAIAPELYPLEEDEEPKVQPKKRSTARRRKRKKS
jgi:tetratricopeptide (TPR) repeat protein